MSEITLYRGHPREVDGVVLTLVDKDTATVRTGDPLPATTENVAVEGGDVVEGETPEG